MTAVQPTKSTLCQKIEESFPEIVITPIPRKLFNDAIGIKKEFKV